MAEATCSVPECVSPKYVRGWCTRHYQRWRAHGDPEHPQQPRGKAPLPRVTPPTQVCDKCHESKPASEFRRDASRRSGITAACKPCLQVYRSERKAARLEAHRATGRASAKRRRESDPASYRAHNQAVYAARAEIVKARMRKWWAEHPDKAAAHDARRRTAVVNTRVETVDLQQLWTGLCALCAKPVDASIAWPDPMSKSIDHIIPLSKGGTHTQDNLQWSHLRCNIRKGDRLVA